jgi:hypothetical protein
MRRQSFGLVTALAVAGVCAGGPPDTPAARDKTEVFTGKVVPLPVPKGGSGAKTDARNLALAADDGTSYQLVEDDASRMLFLDSRLRDRPVRLTALRVPGAKKLQVVFVQTVKGGKVYDVDYWCEVCQISLNRPGPCTCCGDETEFRERPTR